MGGMIDMPNMTNTTGMMGGEKRKLLQEMMDEGMIDMPNMTNMTNTTDMMGGEKRKLLQEMADEGMIDMPNMTNTTDMMGGEKRKLLQDLESLIDAPTETLMNATADLTTAVLQPVADQVGEGIGDLTSSLTG